jgi:hypothetical protein
LLRCLEFTANQIRHPGATYLRDTPNVAKRGKRCQGTPNVLHPRGNRGRRRYGLGVPPSAKARLIMWGGSGAPGARLSTHAVLIHRLQVKRRTHRKSFPFRVPSMCLAGMSRPEQIGVQWCAIRGPFVPRDGKAHTSRKSIVHQCTTIAAMGAYKRARPRMTAEPSGVCDTRSSERTEAIVTSRRYDAGEHDSRDQREPRSRRRAAALSRGPALPAPVPTGPEHAARAVTRYRGGATCQFGGDPRSGR